jgi:hypothetical protein
VHEDVIAAFLLNEPIALAVVEPLHFAYCHDRLTSFQLCFHRAVDKRFRCTERQRSSGTTGGDKKKSTEPG